MNRHLRPRAALLAGCLLAAGCSTLVGGPRETPTIFAPEPARQADPAWPAADWSLVVAGRGDGRMMDGQRIVVSPVPGELQVYRGALWARSPSEMVEDTVLRTLEDSGKLPVAAHAGSGIAGDYRLLLEVRTFKADYAGATTPAAVVEVNAKLLHVRDQAVAGSRTFRQAVPATGTEVARVADAFGAALGSVGHEIAGWTLQAGQAHQRQAHGP